jgi:anti-sigma B factor antagonist
MGVPGPPDPSQTFRAWTEANGKTLIVKALGELDLASAEAFEKELDRALSQDGTRVVVDLAALEFIDSTGLRCLIRAAGAASAHEEARLEIYSGLTPPVERALEVSGLKERLPFIARPPDS